MVLRPYPGEVSQHDGLFVLLEVSAQSVLVARTGLGAVALELGSSRATAPLEAHPQNVACSLFVLLIEPEVDEWVEARRHYAQNVAVFKAKMQLH